MSYVAKVSLPGYNVNDATPEQCSVHSSYPPLKAKLGEANPHYALLRVSFSGVITQGVTHTVYSFPHGYGYIPLTLSTITLYTGTSVTASGIGYTGIGATLTIKAYCDATNFYVTVYDNFNWIDGSSVLEVSYYVFAENGT